jgi:hypothetical protein
MSIQRSARLRRRRWTQLVVLALAVPSLVLGSLIIRLAPGAGGTFTAPGVAAEPAFEPESIQRIDLPPNVTDASTPVFTLDGEHLLFFSGLHLWIVGEDGRGATCLSCGLPNHPTLSPSEQEGFATPFPDGRRVFFGAADSVAVLECVPSLLDCEHRGILPVDLSGARPGAGVVPPGGVDSSPGVDLGGGVAPKLAPDGDHVAFSDIRSDVAELMVLATLTRTPTKYVTSDPRALNPPAPTSPADDDTRAWSDSASLFEFKSFADGGADATYAQVGGPGLQNPDVWQVNLATGHRTRLTSYPDWDEDDAPSPDGRSIVIESDRGMHRVDALGALLPVRDFIDDPESAILAGYLVGAGGSSPDIAALRQCDLQPWLLPASGDRGGTLMGQPLLPYAGGSVHVANNVSGYPQWSPDGTTIALNTQSYVTGLSAPYLLLAHLTSRTPTTPVKVVSSQPGSWAPGPLDYHGPLGGTNHVVLHGLRAGTATVDYHNVKGLFGGTDQVTYSHYSDDGLRFFDGTNAITDANLTKGPITIDTDLTMTGSDTGDEHVHVVFSGLSNTPAVTVTGTAVSTYDGTTLRGIPKAPQPCPDALPRAPRLHLEAHLGDHGLAHQLLVHVTATVGDAGPGESRLDTRAVADSVVTLGDETAHTDAEGLAILAVPPSGPKVVNVNASAGDALQPSQIQFDLTTGGLHQGP